MATNNFVQSGIISLPAAVAASGGTVSVAYPAGFAQADFSGANAGAQGDNIVLVNDNDRYSGAQVSFAYGVSSITITNNSSTTWPANARIRAQYPRPNLSPITGAKSAPITPLTDNSGGTASGTVAAITDVPTRNAVASLIATQAAMIQALKAAGVTS